MLLDGKLYDPAVAVTNKALTSAIAMAAVDTSNLRVNFVGPANGFVLAKIRCVVHGGTSVPHILLGILEGSTVKLRMAPMGNLKGGATATAQVMFEVNAVIPVTAGTSYQWDAAYGVENSIPSSNIKYGGPNDTTTNNAFGGFSFEVHDTAGLLGACLYDPAVAVAKSTASLLAMTALDATNLQIPFYCPNGNGAVAVRVRSMTSKNDTTQPSIFLGAMNDPTAMGNSNVVGRVSPLGDHISIAGVANRQALLSEFIVTGLTPGTLYTWNAAYGVELVGTGGTPNLYYGGPNNTTGNDAYGAIGYEVWDLSYRGSSSFLSFM